MCPGVRCAEAALPTKYGMFRAFAIRDARGAEHIVLIRGDVQSKERVLVRVHSECLTGDVFGSEKCDCGSQLDLALRAIATESCGIICYLRQEGRGIGLTHKIHAYALQEQGLDTVEANVALGLPVDAREYRIVAEILRSFDVRSIRLLTNNPDKVQQLEACGIRITERVPLRTVPTRHNRSYLVTKRTKLGHAL
jgi:GTP cyclohydrolase II